MENYIFLFNEWWYVLILAGIMLTTGIIKQYGLFVDPDAKIEDITVGMQQRVEILKMLFRENEILIFDEPTAVLTPQEIDELMGIMKNLAAEGKSIVFITHKRQRKKRSTA